MKAVNKKNNKYSLKSLLLEEKSELENETIQELNAIVNVYKSLFKDIKEMYNSLSPELQNFDEFKKNFGRFKTIEKGDFSKFINTDFFSKKENQILTPIKNLQTNQFGNDYWRVQPVELPKLKESLQGKAIWILTKFPTWFCDEIKEARKETGIENIIDFVIDQSGQFELKDLYKKIIDNTSCIDDASLMSYIDDIFEKKLYAYLQYYVGSIYSPVEIVDTNKVRPFIDALYQWIKSEFSTIPLSKMKENFDDPEFINKLNAKIIELNLEFESESKKTGQEFSKINQNISTSLRLQILSLMKSKIEPIIKQELKRLGFEPDNEREKKEIEIKQGIIVSEIEKWIIENYKNYTLPRQLLLIFNYPSAKGRIQFDFNQSLTNKLQELIQTNISPNIDIKSYISLSQGSVPISSAETPQDTTSFSTKDTVFDPQAGIKTAPRGRRTIEEIKNNFNLKSLSLKELMEKGYD